MLLMAYGFERLLTGAQAYYAGLRPGERLHALLKDGRLLFLLTTALLPVAILAVLFRLRWAAIVWRAGLSPASELLAALWPLTITLMGGALVMLWDCRPKWLLLLCSMLLWALMVLSSAPAGGAREPGVSGLLGLCLAFACGGWLWWIGQALGSRFEMRGQGWLSRLACRGAPGTGNSLVIVLWVFFLWFVAGQALGRPDERVRFSPTESTVRDTIEAASYIRDNLPRGEEILSCAGEINFLLGKAWPTYWGYHHEQVAARVGISKLVKRELGDLASYCQKHRVRFIVFARGLQPARMGRAGEEYILSHFRAEKWFGWYVIYARI